MPPAVILDARVKPGHDSVGIGVKRATRLPGISIAAGTSRVMIASESRKDRAMDASDLRVFEAVARLGGMNRAAAELNTVQSNVTARIRALEDELGTPL